MNMSYTSQHAMSQVEFTVLAVPTPPLPATVRTSTSIMHFVDRHAPQSLQAASSAAVLQAVLQAAACAAKTALAGFAGWFIKNGGAFGNLAQT